MMLALYQYPFYIGGIMSNSNQTPFIANSYVRQIQILGMFHKTTDCSLPQLESALVPNMQRRWKHLHSGVAGGGGGGGVLPLTANLPKIEKKIWKKLGKIGKIGKKRQQSAGFFTLPLLTDRAGYAPAFTKWFGQIWRSQLLLEDILTNLHNTPKFETLIYCAQSWQYERSWRFWWDQQFVSCCLGLYRLLFFSLFYWLQNVINKWSLYTKHLQKWYQHLPNSSRLIITSMDYLFLMYVYDLLLICTWDPRNVSRDH